MKSQIRKAKPGEDKCDRCDNLANIFHRDGRATCMVHGSLDRDTFVAIQALKKAGLIND